MSALPPSDTLREIFATGRVQDSSGKDYKLHSAINAEHAMALYRTVLKQRPQTIVEVGMACGVATLSMLTALDEIGGEGRVISIDPFAPTHEKDIALHQVEKAGFASRHTLVQKLSHVALPELLEQGVKIEFAYIDGWHSFDYVLVDFFYIDKLLKKGGMVGFNDCGWPAIHRILRFVRRHRRYTECDVGLQRNFKGRNALFTLARYVQQRSGEDRYFRKDEHWDPPADFYRAF